MTKVTGFTDYILFNAALPQDETCLFASLYNFIDCSIRVSRSGCCKACLTHKESTYSAALHVFCCNNMKMGA